MHNNIEFFSHIDFVFSWSRRVDSLHYYNFWLIILPFGIEAIIVTISNTFEKYQKIVDVGLTVCFTSLFISLLILFSYNVFPEFGFLSKYSNMIGIIVFGAIAVIITILNIFTEKWVVEFKNRIFNSFYRISKNIEDKGEYINYIVVVSDDIVLYKIMVDMVGISKNNVGPRLSGYNFRCYRIEEVLEKEMELTKENIAIVTDSQDKLIGIIKKFEKNKNKVLGIITTFKLNEKQKFKLKDYNIEECLVD